jgi:sugar transferase (PEP-CTERM/EpsH1 system associated)
MRILFLTSRIPYPPHRGDKLKIWNLMRQLASRHEIFLLTFIQSKEEERYIAPLKEVCREVETVHLPLWRSLLNCAAALFGKEPFQVAYYRSPAMERRLSQALQRLQPDVLHTHLIRMAQYTATPGGLPRVLDMTDAVSLYLSRFRDAQSNPLKKWALGLELKRMHEYEPIIGQFDRALVCSHTDMEFLRRRGPDFKLDLLRNGVDLEAFSVNGTAQADPYRIMFSGNMSYYPNIDGAKFLVSEVFPLVKKSVPQARLYIVGQNPPSQVTSLASADITVTGFVPDIRAEYLKSAVAVSPIRFGAGTLNKVLEPSALGVPVVTTSIGWEGLGLESEKEILVANDPRSIATAIIRLLKDPTLRSSIGQHAAQKVRATLGWETIAGDLEAIYEQIVKKAR